jgi:hypothetical protein
MAFLLFLGVRTFLKEYEVVLNVMFIDIKRKQVNAFALAFLFFAKKNPA